MAKERKKIAERWYLGVFKAFIAARRQKHFIDFAPDVVGEAVEPAVRQLNFVQDDGIEFIARAANVTRAVFGVSTLHSE